MKRISFSKNDAVHLYELTLENFCIGKATCCQCSKLKKRLENFIGPSDVRFVKKIIKKYPYNKKYDKISKKE